MAEEAVQDKEIEEINMSETEVEQNIDSMPTEMNTLEDVDFDSKHTEASDPGAELIKLLESYEILKDKIDGLQAERNVLREAIQDNMLESKIEYTEVPVPTGRAYKVSLSNRIIETVTREGKSFIKVHSTPELLDSLIKSNERETLAIREMTGVPRQSLFNRIGE